MRWGQLIVECAMHTLGIVPDEPIHELAVECVAIGGEELIVPIHKLFLNRSVESFRMSIHLRCLGIRMLVREMRVPKRNVKIFLEF